MIDESELNILEAGIVSGAFKTLEGYELELLSLARKGLEAEKWKDEYFNLTKFANQFEAERDKLRAALAEVRGTLRFYSEHCAVVPEQWSEATKEHIMRESMIPAKRALARIDEILKGDVRKES